MNKPFPPSARKLKKAKEDGDFAKSVDFSKALLLTVGIIYLFFMSDAFLRLKNLIHESLTLISQMSLNSYDDKQLFSFLNQGLALVLELILPFVGLLLLGAFSAGFLQVGFCWQTKHLIPNLSKFNPSKNLKKLLGLNEEGSAHNIFLGKIIYDIFKSGLVLFLLFVVGYWGVNFYLANFSFDNELNGAMLLFKETLKIIAPILIIISLLIGVLDLGLEKRKRIKRLSMDLEELKKEFKETEGNPEIIGLRKQLQREIALQDLLQNIRKSKVLIVNE
jgi:flagellar biosynthesis protein FlhB